MASSSADTLDQLVALISSSVEVVKAEYARRGRAIPSLDSTEQHPLDFEQPSIEMKKTIRILEGACHHLIATVANPCDTIINSGISTNESACLRVVANTKVADHLGAAGRNGLTLPELAAKTGIDGSKLGRILRFLATKHIFKEVAKDVFANNRLSSQLESNNEVSSVVSFITDEGTLGGHDIYETLSDPDSGPSCLPDKAPVTRSFGMSEGETLYSWYNSKDLVRGARFGRAMIGWGKAATGAYTIAYPWSTLPHGSRVNDIGGGLGQASMGLMRAHPHLKFIVQDLAPTLSNAPAMWQQKFPEGISRVDFVPIDFFKETPVAGCDIYYLRHIIHNWEDKECIEILQNIRKAMTPHSKVLVHDYILQHVNRVSDKDVVFSQAPEPLLPNYGQGCMRPYALDITMMSLFNAKERTIDEFVKLGEKAGFKFLKLYDTGEAGIIEYAMA